MISKILAIFCFMLIVSSNCVKLSSNLVGGRVAGHVIVQANKRVVKTTTEFPYSAMLEEDGKFACGAVIVSPKAVLTAGHCVYKRELENFQIRAGTFNKEDTTSSSVQVRKVESMHLPKRFEQKEGLFDLAVLKLKVNLNFNEYVKAAKLPTIPTADFFADYEAIAFGHGRMELDRLSQTLRIAIFKVLPRRRCLRFDSTLSVSMLCGVAKNGYGNVLCGDSGSPLIVKHNPEKPEQDVVIGVASFSMECSPKLPSVWANLAILRDFILAHI